MKIATSRKFLDFVMSRGLHIFILLHIFMLLHILMLFPATNNESPYCSVLINRKGVANPALDNLGCLKRWFKRGSSQSASFHSLVTG